MADYIIFLAVRNFKTYKQLGIRYDKIISI